MLGIEQLKGDKCPKWSPKDLSTQVLLKYIMAKYLTLGPHSVMNLSNVLSKLISSECFIYLFMAIYKGSEIIYDVFPTFSFVLHRLYDQGALEQTTACLRASAGIFLTCTSTQNVQFHKKTCSILKFSVY